MHARTFIWIGINWFIIAQKLYFWCRCSYVVSMAAGTRERFILWFIVGNCLVVCPVYICSCVTFFFFCEFKIFLLPVDAIVFHCDISDLLICGRGRKIWYTHSSGSCNCNIPKICFWKNCFAWNHPPCLGLCPIFLANRCLVYHSELSELSELQPNLAFVIFDVMFRLFGLKMELIWNEFTVAILAALCDRKCCGHEITRRWLFISVFSAIFSAFIRRSCRKPNSSGVTKHFTVDFCLFLPDIWIEIWSISDQRRIPKLSRRLLI